MTGEEPDGQRDIIHKLVVTIAGPNFVDRFSIESENPDDLKPEYVETNDIVYERYGDEADYVEARFDIIVKREKITQEPKPPSLEEEREDLRKRLSEPGELPEIHAPQISPSPVVREASV